MNALGTNNRTDPRFRGLLNELVTEIAHHLVNRPDVSVETIRAFARACWQTHDIMSAFIRRGLFDYRVVRCSAEGNSPLLHLREILDALYTKPKQGAYSAPLLFTKVVLTRSSHFEDVMETMRNTKASNPRVCNVTIGRVDQPNLRISNLPQLSGLKIGNMKGNELTVENVPLLRNSGVHLGGAGNLNVRDGCHTDFSWTKRKMLAKVVLRLAIVLSIFAFFIGCCYCKDRMWFNMQLLFPSLRD